MKKIYKTIVLLGTIATLGTSCNDWLNVYPSDQIKEEFLFETGDGYRAALNGIYRKMTSWSIYGSNLKWGIIDAWGQVYDMELSAIANGGQPMKKIEILDFKNLELTPTTDQMWSDAWNIVANCNELAQQAELADSTLFYEGESERRMILGEAIGLRAYLQFDLLRVYAPSPAMNPGERTFIPYVNTYPAYVNNRETVSYCLEQIIKDLRKAQDLLLKVDQNSNWSDRFEEVKNDENLFKASRGFRLNYYAVTAELARVYLYAGMPDKAYEQADIIIQKSDLFAALTDREEALKRIKDGNLKMYDDIIFALYSPTDQVEWDRLINHSDDKAEGILVTDTAWLEGKKPKVRTVALSWNELSKADGKTLPKNILALGITAALLGIDTAKLLPLLEKQYGRKGAEVMETNRLALETGYEYIKNNYHDLLAAFTMPTI